LLYIMFNCVLFPEKEACLLYIMFNCVLFPEKGSLFVVYNV